MKLPDLHSTVTALVARLFCLLMLTAAPGCKKYLEVPLPTNRLDSKAVFESDVTTSAALNYVYASMLDNGLFDGVTSVGFLTGLYGDELINYVPIYLTQMPYADSLDSRISTNVLNLWTNAYKQLYYINNAIEGIKSSKSLKYHDQWLGEAYFLRGLSYFYLTNLFGDVPLVLSPDYLQNNQLARSPQADVYRQIVTDLQLAQSMLTTEYKDGDGLVTTGRGRPNRFAASALLARVYLYTRDWQNAEAQSGTIISNGATFKLLNPAQTFLVNSMENIWGLVPYQSSGFPFVVKDCHLFIPANGTPPFFTSLSDTIVAAFEANDLRYINWVGIDSVPPRGTTPQVIYYYPNKYKANGTYTAPQETVVILRLAEQYLIRAEARAQQGNISGAIEDLNVIRTRAGLQPTSATTQPEVLAALKKERRLELFAEEGHRFFDLRRTGDLDSVMTKAAPHKGGTWSGFKAWWPIPLTDIENNPNLTQTPGY